MIVICTNKDRKEYAKNNSIKALMERFPLEKKFEWEKHNSITYGNLISTVKGPQYANPLLLQILEDFANAGTESVISPRIALEAAELLHDCGIECLELIADFKAHPKILEAAIKNFSFNLKFNQLVEDVDTLYKRFRKVENDTEAKEEMVTVKGLLELKRTEIEAIPCTDEKLQDKTNAVKRVNGYIKNIAKTLQVTDTFAVDFNGDEENCDLPF